jgi:hypothetical protein
VNAFGKKYSTTAPFASAFDRSNCSILPADVDEPVTGGAAVPADTMAGVGEGEAASVAAAAAGAPLKASAADNAATQAIKLE